MSTKKFWSMPALIAAMALLPVIAWASCPAEIPRTGQTLCYDTVGAVIDCSGTGQDGDWLAGAAWPLIRGLWTMGTVR